MAEEQKTTEQKLTPADDGSKAVPPKSSNNKTLVIVLIIVGVVILLPALLFGAGVFWLSRGDNAANLTESIVERSTGSDVDIDRDGNSVSIKTNDGSFSVGENQELPENLPDIVVVYNNQTVRSTVTDDNNEDGSVSWSFIADTSDSAETIGNYLNEKYIEKGWIKDSSSTYGDISNYSYTKDDLEASITISPSYGEDGKISISYYVTKGE